MPILTNMSKFVSNLSNTWTCNPLFNMRKRQYLTNWLNTQISFAMPDHSFPEGTLIF